MLRKNLILSVVALAVCAVGHTTTLPSTPPKAPVKAMIQHSHTRLLVKDFEANYKFYKDVLGFKSSYYRKGVYADMETGEMTIALFARPDMSADVHTLYKAQEADAQDRTALIFTVNDVDLMTDQLQKSGVKFVTLPHERSDWGIRVAHFRDPDGNLIEINGPLKWPKKK
jgi:catechol 2,3-dioxygenase-like lactoylglutathione lyase family enzyme